MSRRAGSVEGVSGLMKVDLCLFDIDGTLVDTGGAGCRALEETAEALFGGRGPDLDLAGSTDSGIVMGFHEHFGEEPSPESMSRFYGHYVERLEWNLARGGFAGRVLPGVVALLESLGEGGAMTVGLLTGNIAEGARAKMRHFGLDAHFLFGARIRGEVSLVSLDGHYQVYNIKFLVRVT